MTLRTTAAASLAILFSTFCAPALLAQGRGARSGMPPAGGRPGEARFGGRGFGRRDFEGGGRRVLYPGWGWGYYFPTPYYPETEAPNYPPPEPPVVINQAPSTPPAPVEPLLMEFRNGQWVRVAGGGQLPLSEQPRPPGAAQVVTAPPAVPLPAALIVFRDGHSEEVQKYMIQGNVLYASTDYWSTGVWSRQILMSDLDVPATVKANQERGSKFNLPSGPAEVVLRF